MTVILPENTKNTLLEFFANHQEIEQVLLFGSRANGTAKRVSDVDLAITTTDNASIPDIDSLIDELPTPYLYDIVHLNTLKDGAFREKILKEGVEIYRVN